MQHVRRTLVAFSRIGLKLTLIMLPFRLFSSAASLLRAKRSCRLAIPLCLAAVSFLVACRSSLPDNPPATVDNVDLERYAGLWYELARLPVRFQADEEMATAAYALRDDGTVALVNTAIAPDGSTRTATGTAVPVEGSGNAKLKVSIDNFFARLFGSPPDFGNYWILRLDDDYELSLVGAPDRDTLWLLSRTPEISEARLEDWLQTARNRGYDLTNLIVNNGAFPASLELPPASRPAVSSN